MRAELKELYSLDFDLTSYFPEDPNNFSFWIRAMIGPENEEGSESFDFKVCTPEWLQDNHSSEDVIFGRNLLLVFEYDFDRIQNYLSRYCNKCSGNNWREISTKLSRVGSWEFEDYSF